MLPGTKREIRPLFVLDKTDVGYPVYLWTEMAFLRDQGFPDTRGWEGLVIKEQMKRPMYVATFEIKLLTTLLTFFSKWVRQRTHDGADFPPPCGPPGAPPSFPSPASFPCLLCFPFHELYLTPLIIRSLSAGQLCGLTHMGSEAESKEAVVSRNCAQFPPNLLPTQGQEWPASPQSPYGLACQPGRLPAPSPLFPEAALRKEGEPFSHPRPLWQVLSLAFVLFLKMKLWLDSQISL